METVEQDLAQAYPMFIVEGAGHVSVDDALALVPLVATPDADDTPAQLLNTIVVEAYRLGVTDISIESVADDAAAHVWFGLDGVMLDFMQVPAPLRAALVAHVKMLCGLDDAVHHIPQISRIDFKQVGSENIEIRVVTMPSYDGAEDIRLRMLRAPLELTA